MQIVTYFWRPEVNNEPTHSLTATFMNNGKAFPSFDCMQLPVWRQASQFLSGHWQVERYWISWDLQKPKFLENNPSNTRNNAKFQIKNKKIRSPSQHKLVPRSSPSNVPERPLNILTDHFGDVPIWRSKYFSIQPLEGVFSSLQRTPE